MHCGTIGSCQSAATSRIVKALLVTSLTHVSGTVARVQTFIFTFPNSPKMKSFNLFVVVITTNKLHQNPFSIVVKRKEYMWHGTEDGTDRRWDG